MSSVEKSIYYKEIEKNLYDGCSLSWYALYELMFINNCTKFKTVQYHLYFDIILLYILSLKGCTSWLFFCFILKIEVL